MNDFNFLHDPYSQQWTILATHRSKRPGKETGVKEHFCPFDPGNEANDEEVYRISENSEYSVSQNFRNSDNLINRVSESQSFPSIPNWQVRVVKNKYPFAPVHEVIIHSPDHLKNFDTLSLEHVKKIFSVFRMRFNAHTDQMNVVIFHNFGESSGASLRHPHTQLVGIPKHVDLHIAPVPFPEKEYEMTDHFTIFCPQTSQWPDEVWIAPIDSHGTFGDVTDDELADLSFVMQRLIQLLDMRHGNNFSFNFYIAPWKHWYIRIIPRLKIPGGFELATGVYVNTQDPNETIAFIKEHFKNPNVEKIKSHHQADYHRGV